MPRKVLHDFANLDPEERFLAFLLVNPSWAEEVPYITPTMFQLKRNRTLFEILAGYGVEGRTSANGKLLARDLMAANAWVVTDEGTDDAWSDPSLKTLARHGYENRLDCLRFAELMLADVKKRSAMELVADLQRKLSLAETDVDKALEGMSAGIDRIIGRGNVEAVDWEDHVKALGEKLLAPESQEDWMVVDTGIPLVDAAVRTPLKRGRLVVIGAESSAGKSTFALQMAIHNAKSNGLTHFTADDKFIDSVEFMEYRFERLSGLGYEGVLVGTNAIWEQSVWERFYDGDPEPAF